MEGVEGEIVVGKDEVSEGRDMRKCVVGQKVGGWLDKNFSRAEMPRVWGILVYREVTSMVTSRILGGRRGGEGAEDGEEMVRIFNV